MIGLCTQSLKFEHFCNLTALKDCLCLLLRLLSNYLDDSSNPLKIYCFYYTAAASLTFNLTNNHEKYT